jgi:hypothetical protein
MGQKSPMERKQKKEQKIKQGGKENPRTVARL